MNYKIGDKVRIMSEKTGSRWNRDGEMDKWLGKTMTIKKIVPFLQTTYCKMEEDAGERRGISWNWFPEMIAEFAGEPRHSIHITCTDNKTTHAVKKVDGEIVARSKAVCCPGDEFDFAVGANLAYDRLMRPEKCATETAPTEPTKEDKHEAVRLYCVKQMLDWLTVGKIYEVGADNYIEVDSGERYTPYHLQGNGYLIPLVSRPAEVGEWIMCTEPEGGFTRKGDLYQVVRRSGRLAFFNDPRKEYSCTNSLTLDSYLVLDGYTPEPEKPKEPEYLNMRVVCVANGCCDGVTVGKVYTVKDGKLKQDNGIIAPTSTTPFESLEDLNAKTTMRSGSKFIEFKGE